MVTRTVLEGLRDAVEDVLVCTDTRMLRELSELDELAFTVVGEDLEWYINDLFLEPMYRDVLEAVK